MTLRMFLCCWLLSAAAAVISAQEICGNPGQLSSFIVNGTNSTKGAWPWIAAIHLIEGDRFICGGSLVSSRMVVSAAHCFQDKNPNVEVTVRHATTITVKLGKHDLSKVHERGSEVKYPQEIIIHPEWKTHEQRYNADIAAIIFETPVTFSATIIPICLWDASKPLEKDSGFVVGWGKSESTADHENTPKQLEVQIRDNEECFLKDYRFAIISSKTTFCAGKDNRSGPCKGDSGSGLFMKTGLGRSSRWYLRGIVSAGFVDNSVCDTSVDVIFTDAQKFVEWINQIASSRDVQLPKPPKKALQREGRKSNKEIFCFFESWAFWRDGDSFTIKNLKPELCTTLVYLHSVLNNDNLGPINPDQELDSGAGWYRQFNDLKKAHPHLRTLLAIGSWNEGSEVYSKLAASDERRIRFARNSAEFLKTHNFDGLHFHWEHPAHRGGAPEDKANFVKLLREIKNSYESQNLYLSVFVRTQSEVVEKAYDLRKIGQIADAVLAMTFYYTAPSNAKIAASAPLFGNDDNTVKKNVEYFTKHGVPVEKLVVGIPFFGVSYNTRGDGRLGDDTLNSEGFQGPFYHFNFFIGYNEICRLSRNSGWEENFDTNSSQVVGKFKADGHTNVVVYDSPRSVANKVKFLSEQNLGGAWTWFVDSDDWRGECQTDYTTFADFPNADKTPRKEKDFPLSRTLYEAMEMLSSP